MEDAQRTDFAPDWERMRGAHIAIATPCYGGQLTAQYVGAAFESQRVLRDHGINLSLLLVSSALVEAARNQLVATFLDAPQYTHLLFIDADQGWEPKAILRLLALDRDVIGVASTKKTDAPSFAVHFGENETGTLECVGGALRVEAIGTGFLMIRREALAKMITRYPHLQIRGAGGPVVSEKHHFALFQSELVDGGMWSEDLTFCRRWRAIGGDVWCDPDTDLVHVGTKEYRGALAEFITEATEPTGETQ